MTNTVNLHRVVVLNMLIGVYLDSAQNRQTYKYMCFIPRVIVPHVFSFNKYSRLYVTSNK